MSDDDRFEGTVPCGRVFQQNGNFMIQTLGPLPGIVLPKSRMRDWGEVQVSVYGDVLRIWTDIQLVSTPSGEGHRLDGELSYLQSEDVRKRLRVSRGKGDE